DVGAESAGEIGRDGGPRPQGAALIAMQQNGRVGHGASSRRQCAVQRKKPPEDANSGYPPADERPFMLAWEGFAMSITDTSIPLVFGDYALEDRYRLNKGRVYLTGIQALVRLPMMQKQRDLKAGLNTGGFISGYRGSPLGMYDNALWGAKRYLKENNIHFQPGLNEDLAATAVWGSQQTTLFPTATVDGVFGIWYGKGPGVDRSMDVLKHGNAAGTAQYGGVIALAGDDHGCQSST